MRKSALAAGSAALAIALAGCGDDGNDNGGTSGDTPQSLFEDTEQLAYESSESTDDAETAKFSMKMEGGAQPVEGEGEGRFNGEDSAMSMTMTAMGQETEMRIIDETYYMKLPEHAQQMMSDGKPWVEMSFDDDEMSEMMNQSLEQSMQSSDPTKLLETLQNGGKITKKERTDDGSHYWVDVEPLEMMKETYSSEFFEEMPGDIEEQLEGTTIPTQIWLNNDLLPTKITMDMSDMMSALQQGMGDELQGQDGEQLQQAMPDKMVMKYYDWGDPVDVEKPPEDQVGEFEMPDMGDMNGSPDMPN